MHESVSVIGVERSGTSLVVNLLREWGFYVEDDWRPPDAHNPKGYGESKRLSQINNELLRILGGSRDVIPQLASGWQNDSRLDSLRDKAVSLIQDMERHSMWAWKDPILTVTFPFWRMLLPSDHKCLICVRNPLATVQSQEITFNKSAEATGRTWFVQNLNAVISTKGMKRMFVFYDDFFDDSTRQVFRIARFVNLDGTQTGKCISQELRHHVPTINEALESKKLPVATKLLYLVLLQTRSDSKTLELLDNLVAEPAGLSMNDTEAFFSLQLELEYYKRIADHPYVKFGRKIKSMLRRAL